MPSKSQHVNTQKRKRPHNRVRINFFTDAAQQTSENDKNTYTQTASRYLEAQTNTKSTLVDNGPEQQRRYTLVVLCGEMLSSVNSWNPQGGSMEGCMRGYMGVGWGQKLFAGRDPS